MKCKKGAYGYIPAKRKRVMCYTIVMFAVCITLFITGIVTTGSKKNLLTIVAVLGCLPACKSMVELIMFCKAKGCTEEAYHKIRQYTDGMTELYDLYFTSYKTNYPISHMVLKGNILTGYTDYSEVQEEACEKHLEQMLIQDGYINMTVKIFKDLDKYTVRLEQLKQLETEKNKNHDGIVDMLLSISL